MQWLECRAQTVIAGFSGAPKKKEEEEMEEMKKIHFEILFYIIFLKTQKNLKMDFFHLLLRISKSPDPYLKIRRRRRWRR
jgi:hypothetical protein